MLKGETVAAEIGESRINHRVERDMQSASMNSKSGSGNDAAASGIKKRDVIVIGAGLSGKY